jgi:hypothetical protein
MRDETVIVLGFGLFALLLGGWLTRVRTRHVARVRADREAGRYIPLVDARGIWLFLNGPVTAAIGVAFLGYGVLRGRAEIEEARVRRELGAIELRCRPGALQVALRGEQAREVELVDVRARREGLERGLRLRISGPTRMDLAPGDARALEIALASAGACGEEITEDEARAGREALERDIERAASGEEPFSTVALFRVLDAPGPAAPTGPWPRCAGYSLELVVRDEHGSELARGESYCGFPGRGSGLVLDPSLLYR